MPWSRAFDGPIPLPDGGAFETLSDARANILALPESDQQAEEWQAAVESPDHGGGWGWAVAARQCWDAER